MSTFKQLVGSPTLPKFPYVAVASTAMTAGLALYRDTSSGELKLVTNSVGLTTNIEAICAQTITTAASNPTIEAYPIVPGVLYEAKCANNTAANQLNKAHAITAAGLVSNTSTTNATTAGLFVAIAISGAAADKKLIGYLVKVGQVTA